MQTPPRHTLTAQYYSVTRTPTTTEIFYHDLPPEHMGIVVNVYEHTLPMEEQGKGILIHINQYSSLHELIFDISSTYLPPHLKPDDYGTLWILCEHLNWLNRLAVGWDWFINSSTGIYTIIDSTALSFIPSTYGLVPGTRWIIADPSKIYGVGFLCHDPRLQIAIDTYPQLIYAFQKYDFVEVRNPSEVIPSHFTIQRIYEWDGRFMKSETQNKAVVQTNTQDGHYEKLIHSLTHRD